MEKNEIRRLIAWLFFNHGPIRTTQMVERLKVLGFHHATMAGISLSVDDLKIPPSKKWLVEDAEYDIAIAERRYRQGKITAVERFQKVIDTWHSTSETLKDEVVTHFIQTDTLNPVYMMAFSGARGNLSQVRQLVGMRGLMSDPQGQIIDLPIRSNFREGLTVTEYVISCYGARKGLVDTALRTADSGYLTRRLVDVAQHVIIRETDCGVETGIPLKAMKEQEKVIFSLEDRLIGRVLAENIYSSAKKRYIARRNQDISGNLASELVQCKKHVILVRSPLTCKANRSVCQLCYGWSLAHGNLVDLGEAVGIIAAQSIGEPGTQLTMRTFHTGGVFTGNVAQQIRSPMDGTISYSELNDGSIRSIRTRHGENAFITEKEIELTIAGHHKTITTLSLPSNTTLLVKNGEFVRSKQLIAEVSPKKKQRSQGFETTSKYVASHLTGEVYCDSLLLKKRRGDFSNSLNRTGQDGGLLWVLSGYLSDLFNYESLLSFQIPFQSLDWIEERAIFYQQYSKTNYGGFLLFDQSDTDKESLSETNPSLVIKIINSVSTLYGLYLIDSSQFSEKSWTVDKDFRTLFFVLITPNFVPQQPSNHHFSPLQSATFFLETTIVSPPNFLGTKPLRLGKLLTQAYFTANSGIVRYSGIEVKEYDKEFQGYPVVKGGRLLWIPEEIYKTKRYNSSMFVKHGQYITSGTRVFNDIYAKYDCLVEIVDVQNNCYEIRLKPGTLIYPIPFPEKMNKHQTFIQAGEEIYNGIVSPSLVYLECIHFLTLEEQNNSNLSRKKNAAKVIPALLIRPVIQYFVPSEPTFSLPQLTHQLRKTFHSYTCQYIRYQDNERVYAPEGTELMQIYFMINKEFEDHDIQMQFDIVPISSTQENASFKLDISLFESFESNSLLINQVTATKETSKILANYQEYLLPGQVVTSKEIHFNNSGEIRSRGLEFDQPRQYLTITDSDQIELFTGENKLNTISQNVNSATKQKCNIKLGDFVQQDDTFDTVKPGLIALKGEKRLEKRFSGQTEFGFACIPGSGQIIQLQNNRITIRLARPYLISSEAVLYVNHGDFINVGDTLVMLIYEQSKTGDIIQGLPRIEELLEARRTKGLKSLPDNLHNKLETLFNQRIEKYGLQKAARESLEDIQLFLVKEIQSVYKSQGVSISDKHIEVIVRQMTSKVVIEDGGDTTLLPGELIDLHRIESLNKNVFIHAEYSPVVLGITKASLNTESFISAASFQETTRVLTKAAIEGKTDWLKGLKENVIIGRLIPAGTGFNENERLSSTVTQFYNDFGYIMNSLEENENPVKMKIAFEQIILQDYLETGKNLKGSTTWSN